MRPARIKPSLGRGVVDILVSFNEARDNAPLLACVMVQTAEDMAPARQLLFDLVVAGGDPDQLNGVGYSARIYLGKFPEDFPGWYDTIDSALAERHARVLVQARPAPASHRARRSL